MPLLCIYLSVHDWAKQFPTKLTTMLYSEEMNWAARLLSHPGSYSRCLAVCTRPLQQFFPAALPHLFLFHVSQPAFDRDQACIV